MNTPKGKPAPRSLTNELTIENNLPAADDTTPQQVVNDVTPPAGVVPPVSTPVVVENTTPPTVTNTQPTLTVPPVQKTVATVTNSADGELTRTFNNALNAADKRAVFNICDANRVLPGAAPVMTVSLWSLVTKVPVTNSIDVVRQLTNIVVEDEGACPAAADGEKSMDLSVDYTALLGNYFAVVPVCNRTLRRNEMNDAYIRANMTDSAEMGLDKAILSGAFTNSKGLKGIIADSGTITLSAEATLGAALGALLPQDLAQAVIVLRPADWFNMLETAEQLKGCCLSFVNGITEMRYLGARVVPSIVMPETVYAVIGNFSKYIAGYCEVAAVTADTSIGFREDKTYFKVQVEAGGGSNATKRTVEGTEVSSFVVIPAEAAGG